VPTQGLSRAARQVRLAAELVVQSVHREAAHYQKVMERKVRQAPRTRALMMPGPRVGPHAPDLVPRGHQPYVRMDQGVIGSRRGKASRGDADVIIEMGYGE
jgi:hypothetical protein